MNVHVGGVQVSLEREGVLWKRGVLAMPLIVRQCIQLMQAILDRLVAVELMLLQKPIVSGRYSGILIAALLVKIAWRRSRSLDPMLSVSSLSYMSCWHDCLMGALLEITV